MNSIKSKSDRKKLVADFNKEMATRAEPLRFRVIGIAGLWQLMKWDWFNRLRLLYFMVLILRGYSTSSAFYYAKEHCKETIRHNLELYGWK